MSCNGWTNWSTWTVAVYLANIEWLHEKLEDILEKIYDEVGGSTSLDAFLTQKSKIISLLREAVKEAKSNSKAVRSKDVNWDELIEYCYDSYTDYARWREGDEG